MDFKLIGVFVLFVCTFKGTLALRNCYELFISGVTTSGMYQIDPDREGGVAPFMVQCDMTTATMGITNVNHNRMTITTLTGPTTGGAYPLTYDNGVTVAQLIALIDSSESCAQQLRYQCQNSRIFRASDSIAITYWKDRNEDSQFNWGTETNVKGCACRAEGLSVCLSARCRCDTESSTQQVDEGDLTDKSLLPVTEIFIGLEEVDGAGEVAGFLAGGLRCMKSDLNLYPSCSALKEANLLTTDSEYLIDPDGVNTGVAPFLVRCDVDTGYTEVVHNFPGTNSVPASTANFYEIDLDYDNTVSSEQLSLLAATSEDCWQWLSLECKSVRIFNGNAPVSYWVAHDGDTQLNWAAPEGVTGCGCSQEFEITTSSLTVTQSYTLNNANPASYAIDLTVTAQPAAETATCQVAPQDPANPSSPRWWAVDFGQSYCISHVKITNTATNNVLLSGAYVTVGDSSSYATNGRCRENLAIDEVNTPSGVVPVYCKPQSCGRYLAVIHPTQTLSMCHIQIYSFQNFPHAQITLNGLMATQSSVLWGGVANHAIDGNSNTNFLTGQSCIVSGGATGVSQWWAVEFREYQCVSRVVIKNRHDCCYDKLVGASVRVGSNADYGQNAICGTAVTSTQALAGADVVFECTQPLCGTHLSVVSAPGGYLTFCEIWAWAPVPHDIAIPLLNLPVSQSSMLTGGSGRNAIDGNENAVFADGSCSSTAEGQAEAAWWRVDLGESGRKCVSRVVIKNRADAEWDRLAGAVVRVGDSTNYVTNALCGMAVAEAQSTSGATVTVWCMTAVCGRYISVHQAEGDMVLALCEVWAFATLPDPTVGACTGTGNKCNCDANDSTLRMDAGYIREKNALPIREVRVGDVTTAGTDLANVEVGPLQCQGQAVPVLKSCQELYANGYDYSGRYQIDVDGTGPLAPFYVSCDMTQNRGRTDMNHNQETPVWIPESTSSLGGSYRRTLAYDGASMAQIKAVVDASTHCQQFVKLDCYNYEIWNGGVSRTWWVDRDGGRQENWGSPAGTSGCACSVTNNCFQGQQRCSCDNNDAVWRFDEGHITNKDKLPVTEVRTGGITGVTERGRIEVGKLTCWGLNECTAGLHRCHTLANCVDQEDGYMCTCKTGYKGTGFWCEDINECTEGGNNCAAGRSTCTNTIGSFTCACIAGYAGDGATCTDVQECTTGANNCHAAATCMNRDGTFICVCNTGYIGNGVTCEDVNECDGTNQCDRIAVCTNTPGGHTCACPAGYTGSGSTTSPCQDIDECLLNTDDCGTNAYCLNTQGFYGCHCNAGYTGNGRTCVDTNECTDNVDNCGQNANCINTEGSFTCTCINNFRGDGRSCVDINECAENRDDCSDLAVCTNTIGSYGCECREGYIGNGRTCTTPTTAEPPLLSTEALIGLIAGGAVVIVFMLVLCCFCCLFAARSTPQQTPRPLMY